MQHITSVAAHKKNQHFLVHYSFLSKHFLSVRETVEYSVYLHERTREIFGSFIQNFSSWNVFRTFELLKNSLFQQIFVLILNSNLIYTIKIRLCHNVNYWIPKWLLLPYYLLARLCLSSNPRGNWRDDVISRRIKASWNALCYWFIYAREILNMIVKPRSRHSNPLM